MPELKFDDIGRGSLAYRTQFDPEDPGMGPNPVLTLAAFLGAKWMAKGAKWGSELWEKTGGKALKDLKAGLFGKGTRNAAEVSKAIEEEASKEGVRVGADALSEGRIAGQAVDGTAVVQAAEGGEKLGAKEGEKIGTELLVKESEKEIAKSLGKKIPGVALLIGGYFAWDRLSKGDMEGAKTEIESGAIAGLPGIGTVTSLAMDGSLFARDKMREQMASSGIDPNRPLNPTGEVVANGITGAIRPAGSLIESSTRTFVSAVEGLSEKGAFNNLGSEKLSGFAEEALALERTLGGDQLANMTRPVAAFAERMLGLHENPTTVAGSTPAGSEASGNSQSDEPVRGTAQFQKEEARLRAALNAQAPERVALQTEATYGGHPTAVDQVNADQARDLEKTYAQTQLQLQMLESSRPKGPEKETPSPEVNFSPGAASEQKQSNSLLTRIQAVKPSFNPGPYLPASLSEADRSGVNMARAQGREREAIDRFMGSLNVAPLSAQFRSAIRSQERGITKAVKTVQEEQTVGAA
jgi:hypothetical protein